MIHNICATPAKNATLHADSQRHYGTGQLRIAMNARYFLRYRLPELLRRALHCCPDCDWPYWWPGRNHHECMPF